MKNQREESFTPDSELQLEIDRMVDGELQPGATRTLLATLEEQPALWRALALAFVEAQAFSDDMAGLMAPDTTPAMKTADAPVAISPRDTKQNAWSHSTLIAAMAASFLLAFALSSAAYWGLNGIQSVTSPGMIAGSPTESSKDEPLPREIVSPIEDTPVPNQPSQLAAAQPSSVTVVVDQTGDQIQLPVYNTSTLSDEDIRQQWSQAAAVQPELVRRLEEEGHAVSQRTHLRQYWLENGQLLIVPIDELEVTPVSLDPRYQ